MLTVVVSHAHPAAACPDCAHVYGEFFSFFLCTRVCVCGLAALMKVLPKLTALTYLDLRDNPISPDTKIELAATVAKCPGLRADWTADVSTTVLLASPKDKVDPHNRYYQVEGETEEIIRPIHLSYHVHKTQPRYLCVRETHSATPTWN